MAGGCGEWFEASAPGQLPADGPATLMPGLGVPAGRVDGIWVTDAPVADAGRFWCTLARSFRDTGLWPVVLDQTGDPLGPWDMSQSPPGTLDLSADPASRILRALWADATSAEEEDDEEYNPLAPFSAEYPGLAPQSTGCDSENLDRAGSELARARIGLVPARRPAETVAITGHRWGINMDLSDRDIAAVLLSWEERFGAVTAGFGSTLDLFVQGPPATVEAALPIAAEHYAICPDLVDQGAGTIGAYAAEIVGRRTWKLWWD